MTGAPKISASKTPKAPLQPAQAPKPPRTAAAVPQAKAPVKASVVKVPDVAAAPAAEAAHYPNCTAARAAGAAPLLRGQPGYRAALDRDGDGVACE